MQKESTERDQNVEFLARAWAPIDARPLWQWCEAHIRLDKTSPIEGAYSTDYMPFVRWVYDRFQDPHTRQLTLIVAAQCWKTQLILNCLAWCVACDPATSMFVMSSKIAMDEFVAKRLRPGLAQCDAIAGVMPRHRRRDKMTLIQFDTMNLIMRGSESRAGLQSDPVRRTFCDERKLWRKGAIDDLRKRQRTFNNSIEVSAGNAGEEHDELHADWLKGSQTFFHVKCLACQHSQPIRFGRKATSMFPARERGGIVWPTNEETKPGGIWNYEAIQREARWECEACGHLHKDSDKIHLLKTWHAVSRNPGALPEHASVHGSAFYMIWSDCHWGKLAKEFLMAVRERDEHLNLEPLRSFTCETEGEPWQKERADLDPGELGKRKGDYLLGEPDPVGKSMRIMTVDVQAGYLVYVCRQHFPKARSRLLACGNTLDFEELRGIQVRLGVIDPCVWLDSAHRPMDVGKVCLMNGWNALLGDDAKEFTRQEWDADKKEMKAVKSHWKPVEWDPGCGTVAQGRRVMLRHSWCCDHYKDRMYLHLISGDLGEWTIAKNTPDDYLTQVKFGYRLIKEITNNVVIFKWQDWRRRDFADCELMQLVVADAWNMI